METIKTTQNHIKNNYWVSHTLQNQASTSASRITQRNPTGSSFIRNGSCDQQNEIARGFGACASFSKFPVIDVFSYQKQRRCPSHIQSTSSQPLCIDGKIQTSQCFSGPRLFTAKRLAMQNRPLSGILPCTDLTRSQEISPSRVPERATANDLFTIWSQYCAKGLCDINELDSPDPQGKRNTNFGIFGRFPNRSPKYTGVGRPYTSSHSDSRVVRLDSQLRKVSPRTVKKSYLFRCPMEPLGKSKTTSQRESGWPNYQVVSAYRQKTYKSRRNSEPCRISEFRELCSSKGSAELPSSAKFPQSNADLEPKMAYYTSRSQKRHAMVAPELRECVSHSHTAPLQLFDDGCLRHCMGSAIKQPFSFRSLVSSRTTLTLQPKRNAGNPKSFARSLSAPEREYSFSSERQQNCDSISPPRRRDQIGPAYELDVSNLSNIRRVSDICKSFLYSRHLQYSCGSSVENAPLYRMAPSDRMYRKSVSQMGHTNDRSFCVQSSSCSRELCFTGSDRPESIVSRRVFTDLDISTGVDFPPAMSRTEGIKSSQQCAGDIPTSSSSMASSLLASGPEDPSISTPVHSSISRQSFDRCRDRSPTAESTGNDTRGLEVWGWSGNLKSWNEDQVKLLQKSWRVSTRKTYDIAWKRWLDWSNHYHIDSFNPGGGEVARFLSDLHLVHKLSYNTILLHKSVISTLCNPDTAGQISSHILVKQILKSIALQKPNRVKPPIWNIDTLASFLSSYKIDHNNTFQVQRHTATLLLLCSGRRIHDLTLLMIDKDHCYRSNSAVVLWPIFGSKTDTSDHRQSGWQLLSNKDNRNLDPVYWIGRTIDLLDSRRSGANLHNLFVSVRGPQKPASKTVISGWIRTLFKDAGIKASPGSIRSAVASKNWVDNFPMEEILSRGNWRTQNTFCKFYRRTILPSSSIIDSNSKSVTTLFNPVD